MATDNEDAAGREARFQEILHDYLQAVDAGQAPDREEILRRHPEFAAELSLFFETESAFERVAGAVPRGQPAGDAAAPSVGGSKSGTLGSGQPEAPSVPNGRIRYFGDYELVAEIGRGAMGVVYKA